MPNELRFDVQFTRSQMEEILKNPDVSFVVVWGTYVYQGAKVWEMDVYGQGYGPGLSVLSDPPQTGCPRPCP